MPGPKATKLGHALAKGFGIRVERPIAYRDEVTRGESVFSSDDSWVEEPPHTIDSLKSLAPTRKETTDYFISLFPFLQWITRYNLQWLIGDLVAGITVGAVVVPQGMSYATLANLEPQFGLYSSFMGVIVYWFFATSKDITIGPVAVMSQLVGNIVLEVGKELPDVPPHVIASALSVIAGAIVLFIGLIRFGWIVDLISLTALSAYMTGSAISIAAGQVPTMLGESGFNTRAPTYQVIVNTLKHLPSCKIDAAMGLTALLLLYLIRIACSVSAKRYPRKQRIFFFLSTLRTAFVILLYTMISWLVNRHRRTKPLFKILQNVPRGFQNAAAPEMNTTIIKGFVSYLPVTVIVLLMEHIAISKSFGRVNNYTINPSQEMVAIGITNVLGPFLGGYPATGSFSRTAIKSKAGVRTPLAGVITGLVVLLAIYALPPVFYYIPNASLSAVIIHAVGDLITPPNTVYQFWRVSPFEVVIFFVGVLVTVFSSIENGIYSTISISAAMLLFRILRSKGKLLGRVEVHSVLGDQVIGKHDNQAVGPYGSIGGLENEHSARSVFLPLDHSDGSNPNVDLQTPYPGVFIYRFAEGFTYPNAAHTLENLVDYIFKNTRRTNLSSYPRPGDRPWNDPGPSRSQLKRIKAGTLTLAEATGEDESKPTLKAVILDFSSVNYLDITSVQTLIDVRNQLDRYASPNVVDWHIASISNRWAKRALVSAGFGYPTDVQDAPNKRWKAIFSVAEIGGRDSAAAQAEREAAGTILGTAPGSSGKSGPALDIEEANNSDSVDDDPKTKSPKFKGVTVHGLNRPLFHVDLTSALQSAIANIEARTAQDAEVRPESVSKDITKE
ncbi:solute carrier family 26 (sodium-independent sulfate anion transporter), member 11 [Sporothrix brasiliensis 5110]|uniref:Solute carrier family 26 (Sodium-independent sulfate anion transporter), member 11 n=1 Tax=Sporothrix brasiliensis 5110 TaxID=1398154 RepID=A0A0C2EKU3_9PEZI|nr:solute carrier family 26 (sodium-independent sulfate anion transporter), member 11 [Sporothrix brasiliensis 5110]KIH86674.1 solute carrier family 26 (sodium-independent sulfate anion transporter), member 11 [Sporothrix brasiliensis 5110]